MKNQSLFRTLWQKKWWILLILILLGFLTYALINLYIVKSTKKAIFSQIEEVPQAQVALILGAGLKADGSLSGVLEDRTLRALELYEAGKVEKLLASGDNGQWGVDQVSPIREYLLDHGIPASDIFMDHAGFDTYDSLYRAQYIFQVESVIVVTQAFHLPRAVYIGERLGIQTHGYTADRQVYLGADYYQLRESLARLKAFVNIILRSKPTYLGDSIPITEDGQLSWY